MIVNPFSQIPLSDGDEIRFEPTVYGKNFKNEFFLYNLPHINRDQRAALEKAKKFALDQSIEFQLHKQSQQASDLEANVTKKMQAITLVSRIYIGSIFFEIGEGEIRKAFDQFGPIRTVVLSTDPQMGRHKGYAFLEYERPEAAMLALQYMNGHVIGGRGIKVGRPSNAPPLSEMEQQLRDDHKNRKRLYVTGVHLGLNENDLTTVFEAFGPVKSCRMVPDPLQPGQHKGFGYVEFEEEESASIAVQGMVTNFELAGQFLRCTRAMVPFDFIPPVSAAAAAAQTSAASKAQKAVQMAAAVGEVTILNDEIEQALAPIYNPPSPQPMLQVSTAMLPSKFSDAPVTVDLPPPGVFIPPPSLGADFQDIKEHREISRSKFTDHPDKMHQVIEEDPISDVTEPLTREQWIEALEDSRVLLLENLIDPAEVDEELDVDVADECSKFGEVIRVLVHARRQDVRVFVQFDSTEGAHAGLSAMHGRFFAGRQLSAWLYPNERYQMRQLDDEVF